MPLVVERGHGIRTVRAFCPAVRGARLLLNAILKLGIRKQLPLGYCCCKTQFGWKFVEEVHACDEAVFPYQVDMDVPAAVSVFSP